MQEKQRCMILFFFNILIISSAGLLLASIKIFTVGKMLLLSADHHAGRRLCNLLEHRFSVPDIVSPPRPPLFPGSTILQSRFAHKQESPKGDF